jgi:hypothetical protein
MELDKWFFGGGDKIDGSDLARSEVQNAGACVDAALKRFKWGAGAIGCVVLHLSPDNRRILAGEFVTRGELDTREVRIEAEKLWPDADSNVSLVIKIPKADVFKFTEGGLWSDLVGDEELAVAVQEQMEGRTASTVAEADRAERGIERFCIRMVCQLSGKSCQAKGLLAKYHILLFPRTKEAVLEEGAHARLGSLPGIKLCEGELPLGPPPSVQWQCPIVPFTLPGTAYEQLAVGPAPDRLRAAIAAVMGKATAPEVCKSVATLAAKWEKLRRQPGEGGLKPPQVRWPNQQTAQEPEGRVFIQSFISKESLGEIQTNFRLSFR